MSEIDRARLEARCYQDELEQDGDSCPHCRQKIVGFELKPIPTYEQIIDAIARAEDEADLRRQHQRMRSY